MIKIYRNEELLEEYKEFFNEVNKDTPLIKEIISKDDYSSYSLASVSLKNTPIIRFKIKDCGTLHVLIENQKNDYFDLIKKLKEVTLLEVNDLETATTKMKKAVELVNQYHPLLFVYAAQGDLALEETNLKELGIKQTFYLKLEKEEKKQEPTRKSIKEVLKEDLQAIKRFKYHFIFIVVSSFLFGFAITVGFYNALASRMIAIFFFVCALFGLLLNTSISVDYFEVHKFKERLFIYKILFNLLGLLISVIGVLIFFSVNKGEAPSIIALGKLIAFNIGISLGGLLLSIGVANLTLFIKKKIKAKKLQIEEAQIEEVKEETKDEE